MTTLRRHARAIFQAGLEAADPREAVLRNVIREEDILRIGGSRHTLSEREGIWIVGMGKASAAMAKPLTELLEDRILGGLLVVKDGHTLPLPGVEVREAGHPVPDGRGVAAVERMMGILEGAGPSDMVICLISGGGSALSPSPRPPVTLEDKQEVTRLLLHSGATIHEINTVRKHLSRIKGGRLAHLAFPARVVSLILSDVVGDDLHTIASGPTVPDPTTFGHALGILEARGIRESAPGTVTTLLQAGVRGDVPETANEEDPVFKTVTNLIVGSNGLALAAAEEKARELGYATQLLSGLEEGEAREVAREHVEAARGALAAETPSNPPLCLLSGGEATVTVQGDGLGGRNQEFALAAALEMEGMEGALVLSGGTDGTDGPTDAAGALADGESVVRARALGMEARDYLQRNDSYHFFEPLGDLIRTGPTLTNVMDLRLVLLSSP